MFGKRILGVALLAFLVVALLSAAGASSYRTGWSQGYFAGQQSAGREEQAAPAVPSQPYEYGRPWGHGWGPDWGFAPFWLVGGFFKCLLFLLFLGLLGRLFFWGRWGWGRGHGHPHWHGPKGPWSGDEPADEPIMKA
ncbi:MAG: hypothetical protein L0332_05415 [Chloroflexi bacterium]|nr:hypothetical protein [Chloroflexota bacterium]MCI0579919.1 hypothetical protein [Chloroflexota bacterium]MCI0646502.1 hypothetical protein [Chloroflexota bacterium]MCI0726146.1 hypothetical protein [Chloroflexota bacterium]